MPNKTVHLVYVKGEGIRTPPAITNELSSRLAATYKLQIYDWAETKKISPSPGDVLIGHPHPDAATVFRKSFRDQRWEKRIVMIPFRHRPYYREIAWWDPLIRHADHFLAICGRYWVDTIDDTWVSHWKARLRRLDLAIDRDHFPRIKRRFAAPGNRKFLFIGWNAPYKGFDYFVELVKANTDVAFSWAGPGTANVKCPGLRKLGYLDFALQSSKDLVKEHDFLITCGRSDPNPTTILEAAAWGLVPVCTPQSGYYKTDWLVNIPLDDVDGASRILADLNACDESELIALRNNADRELSSHYTWDRFAQDVMDCIDSPADAARRGPSWTERIVAMRNIAVLGAIRAKATLVQRVGALNCLQRWWWSYNARKQK